MAPGRCVPSRPFTSVTSDSRTWSTQHDCLRSQRLLSRLLSNSEVTVSAKCAGAFCTDLPHRPWPWPAFRGVTSPASRRRTWLYSWLYSLDEDGGRSSTDSVPSATSEPSGTDVVEGHARQLSAEQYLTE